MSDTIFYFIGTRPNIVERDGIAYVSDRFQDIVGVQEEDLSIKLFDQYAKIRPTASHDTASVFVKMANNEIIRQIETGEDSTGRIFDLAVPGAKEEAKSYLYERRAKLCDKKAELFDGYRVQYVDNAEYEHEKAVKAVGKKTTEDLKAIAKKGRKKEAVTRGKIKGNTR